MAFILSLPQVRLCKRKKYFKLISNDRNGQFQIKLKKSWCEKERERKTKLFIWMVCIYMEFWFMSGTKKKMMTRTSMKHTIAFKWKKEEKKSLHTFAFIQWYLCQVNKHKPNGMRPYRRHHTILVFENNCRLIYIEGSAS